MIAGLKPYPAMKDSGVPWLGMVPEHWEVRRLKQVFRRIVGGATPASEEATFWDGDVVWVTPADVSRSERLSGSLRRITYDGLQSCSAELVPRGSLVVTSRAPVGNIAIADTELCTNQGCKALVSAEDVVNPMFGFHTLKTMKSEVESLASGTTFAEISTSRLGGVLMPLPPVKEQVALISFLDYVDRRIRRYIHAKQKLIKLLVEQKQATIHRAVTRGLDPNVRLKPSGVEWLRDVPEHWEIRRNGRLFTQRNEIGFPDLPILEVSLKTGVRIRDFETSDRKQVMADREKYKRAAGGDIAYNMMRMWQGAVGVAPVDGLVSPAYVVAKPLPGTEPRYFAYLFRIPAYMEEVDKYSRGIVKDRNRLYWEDFKQIPSCYPPFAEQVAIVEGISQLLYKLTAAIDHLHGQISLVHEYRTRLIADVVTGKLDVREAAKQLPVDADEPELCDESDVDIDEEAIESEGEMSEEVEA